MRLKVLYYYLKSKFAFQPKTRAALEALHQKKFLAFQRNILSKSNYFKPFLERALSHYPLMNKKVMMDYFDTINTVGIKAQEGFKVAIEAENSRNFKPMLNNHIVGLSTGTSGSKGLFVVSQKEKLLWLAEILAKLLPTSLLYKHRIALFMRANSNLYESLRLSGRISFQYFDLSNDLSSLINQCECFNPTILVCPPKVLKIIAKAQRNGIIHIRPIKIISIADVLEEQDKNFIENTFKQIVHQIYQCTEGFLGATCKFGTIHLNEKNIIIEKEWVDKINGKFIPIITDLKRTTQPIVRYRLNDVLTLKKSACQCNSPYLAIESIEGREDQILYFKSSFNSGLEPIFPDFIRRAIITASDSIDDYQVTQLSPTTLCIGISQNNDDPIHSEIYRNIVSCLSARDLVIPEIHFVAYKETKMGDKLMRIRREFTINE